MELQRSLVHESLLALATKMVLHLMKRIPVVFLSLVTGLPLGLNFQTILYFLGRLALVFLFNVVLDEILVGGQVVAETTIEAADLNLRVVQTGNGLCHFRFLRDYLLHFWVPQDFLLRTGN